MQTQFQLIIPIRKQITKFDSFSLNIEQTLVRF